jgi:DNA-binding MarR family transcriptional regulator
VKAAEELLGIRRVVALWESRLDAELGAVHGISLSEFAALFQLWAAPGGRLRRVDLARRLALTPSGISRLLAPLEKRGIVSREADGHDARASYAVLTRAGKTLASDAKESVELIADSILGSLGTRDRSAFAKLVTL